MKVLITGARAPYTLDLIRFFGRKGHEVYTVDSIDHALGKSSRYTKKHYKIPSPRFETHKFIDSIIEIVRENDIHLIIPTCEEMLYLAEYKEFIEPYARLFADDFEKLLKLHHKGSFLELMDELNVAVPKTYIAYSPEDIIDEPGKKKIYKAVYSRFGSHLRLSPPETIEKSNPWLVQDFIEGRSYATFSIAKNGKILAHTAYPVNITLGGASMYYEAVDHPKLYETVKTIIEKLDFTGQVGFDFIESPQGDLYAIECNPRLTGGLHLFSEEILEAYLGNPQKILTPPVSTIRKFLGGMFVYHPKDAFRTLGKGKDILLTWDDPYPSFYYLLSLWDFHKHAKKEHVDLLTASSYDMDFNG